MANNIPSNIRITLILFLFALIPLTINNIESTKSTSHKVSKTPLKPKILPM